MDRKVKLKMQLGENLNWWPELSSKIWGQNVTNYLLKKFSVLIKSWDAKCH
jgi:hypothetical protein